MDRDHDGGKVLRLARVTPDRPVRARPASIRGDSWIRQRERRAELDRRNAGWVQRAALLVGISAIVWAVFFGVLRLACPLG